eukprot:2953241-Pleurochrysis_carterae.AAC.1
MIVDAEHSNNDAAVEFEPANLANTSYCEAKDAHGKTIYGFARSTFSGIGARYQQAELGIRNFRSQEILRTTPHEIGSSSKHDLTSHKRFFTDWLQKFFPAMYGQRDNN